jgi:uncharacterized protein (TIGR01244 family)
MKQKRFSAFCFLLITVPLFSQDYTSFPQKLDPAGFRSVLAQVDSIYISGQPEEASFAKLKAEGVTTVINLRTGREMNNRENVPFDEKQVVEDLGMSYVHIPLGGEEHPYTPQALKTFADTLASAHGKVLLHCTVAGRASHMWAAYLIAYQGFPPAKAIEYAKAINFSDLPLEGLLGKKMIIDFK